MNTPKIIRVDNGGRTFWMLEDCGHLFESRQHAINYSELYPVVRGPWAEASDQIEREEKARDY